MGLFIARISRGRTIREFVAGVLIVPSLLAVVWFTAFGGSALYQEIFHDAGIAAIVMDTVELALFATLAEFPLGGIMSALAVILIVIFFITSADSASYTLGAMTSQGSLNPTLYVKLAWGFLIAGTAAVLLLSGGLEGLQTASIVAALPFSLIMLVMVVSMMKMFIQDLKKEKNQARERERRRLKEEILTELEEEIEDFNRDTSSSPAEQKKKPGKKLINKKNNPEDKEK